MVYNFIKTCNSKIIDFSSTLERDGLFGYPRKKSTPSVQFLSHHYLQNIFKTVSPFHKSDNTIYSSNARPFFIYYFFFN